MTRLEGERAWDARGFRTVQRCMDMNGLDCCNMRQSARWKGCEEAGMVVNHTANTARFDDGVAEESPADLYRFDTIAAGVDGFDAVTDADLDTFRELGYLVIHHAFTPAET